MITDNIKLINEKIGGFPEEPHYLVGSKKIYKWNEAFETAQNTCTTPDKNEIWEHLKFKFDINASGPEPKETIRELYIQRAKQLRKQFDYVRIWVSGGNDSTNTIESFIDAGVIPDELATYVQFPGTYTFDTNPEISVTLAMYIENRKIRKLWPSCKIKTYYQFPDQINWYARNHVEHFIGTRSVNLFSQCFHNIFECYPDMLKNQKGSVAEIYSGPDYLDVGIDEKGWYYNFVDKSFNLHFIAPNQRWFYADPSNPELILKTAYFGKKIYQQTNGNKIGSINFKFSNQPLMDYYQYNRERILDIRSPAADQSGTLYACDSGPKMFARIQNLLTSDLGFDTLMCVLSYYKELQDKHPHWFVQGKIGHNFIGQRSARVYFEN
jgi:hypothetical protein